jgi:hypothetical protein
VGISSNTTTPCAVRRSRPGVSVDELVLEVVEAGEAGAPGPVRPERSG